MSTTELLARVGTIASIITPIVVVIVGVWHGRVTERGKLQKEYLDLSLRVLENDAGGGDASLRSWAVDLLSAHSPVKMPDELKQKLRDSESGALLAVRMVFNQDSTWGDLTAISSEADLLVAAIGPKLQILRLSSGDHLQQLQMAPDGSYVSAASFSPSGRMLAVGAAGSNNGSGGTVAVYRVVDGLVLSKPLFSQSGGWMNGSPISPTSVAFSQDEKEVFVRWRDQVWCLDSSDGSERRRFYLDEHFPNSR